MSVLIKININELNPQFVEELQAKYGDANLEIKITETDCSEDEFWKIIALLDWSKKEDDEAIVQPVVDYLSHFSTKAIFDFQDFLSEKLYQLDGQVYAENMGENAYNSQQYFSADLFLYARCCVVANGREEYEKVLKDPTQMPKDLFFEPLLYLASEAYQLKTGEELNRLPAYIYETFFNVKGWGTKAIQL